MVQSAGAYPSSVALNNQEYLYFPCDGMLVHPRVTPSINNLYTWVERVTVSIVSCSGTQCNDPRPLDPESRAPTPRLPHLPHIGIWWKIKSTLCAKWFVPAVRASPNFCMAYFPRLCRIFVQSLTAHSQAFCSLDLTVCR